MGGVSHFADLAGPWRIPGTWERCVNQAKKGDLTAYREKLPRNLECDHTFRAVAAKLVGALGLDPHNFQGIASC